MKTYRILASYTNYVYADITAENADEAYEIATQMDGGEFTADSNGDWNINDVIEMEKI